MNITLADKEGREARLIDCGDHWLIDGGVPTAIFINAARQELPGIGMAGVDLFYKGRLVKFRAE